MAGDVYAEVLQPGDIEAPGVIGAAGVDLELDFRVESRVFEAPAVHPGEVGQGFVVASFGL